MIRWFKRFISAVLVGTFLAACGSDDDKNIVQTAQADPQFSILSQLLVATGLDKTLSGPGPFTVFAPTNAAFAAFLKEYPEFTLEGLLTPAARPLVTQILTYHVLNGQVLKAQVPLGKPIATVEGDPLTVNASGPDLLITDAEARRAKIIATDLLATNGVIHVIDRVILPDLPPTKNIVQTAQADPQFSILVQLLKATGLDTVLSGPGPFTVFAPTNAAFAAFLVENPQYTLEGLLSPAARPLVTQILTYHVLGSRVLAAQVPLGQPITTVQGSPIRINLSLSDLIITDTTGPKAKIVLTDVLATNGVIHVIDKVLLPVLR